MSGEGDVAPVEQEYRREEHHEQKAMDSKQPCAKFRSNILSRAFDDDRSVGSAKSGKPLLAQLFFQNAAAKVAAPIGEASLAGNVDYNMYSSFLTASSGSVLFRRSNLLKRKDLCFSCLRLGLIRHRRSKRSSHLFSK